MNADAGMSTVKLIFIKKEKLFVRINYPLRLNSQCSMEQTEQLFLLLLFVCYSKWLTASMRIRIARIGNPVLLFFLFLFRPSIWYSILNEQILVLSFSDIGLNSGRFFISPICREVCLRLFCPGMLPIRKVQFFRREGKKPMFFRTYPLEGFILKNQDSSLESLSARNYSRTFSGLESCTKCTCLLKEYELCQGKLWKQPVFLHLPVAGR